MLRTGAAAGTAAALGVAGLFAAGTARAATTAGSGTGGLPYPAGVTDTSHCTPEAAKVFHGFFTAKSEHDLTALMSYFSTANTTYIDACLGISLPSWQAVASTFGPVFASAPASAISYPLRIAGDTRSAMVELVDTPRLFVPQELRALSSVTFDSQGKITRWVDSASSPTARAPPWPTPRAAATSGWRPPVPPRCAAATPASNSTRPARSAT